MYCKEAPKGIIGPHKEMIGPESPHINYEQPMGPEPMGPGPTDSWAHGHELMDPWFHGPMGPAWAHVLLGPWALGPPAPTPARAQWALIPSWPMAQPGPGPKWTLGPNGPCGPKQALDRGQRARPKVYRPGQKLTGCSSYTLGNGRITNRHGHMVTAALGVLLQG